MMRYALPLFVTGVLVFGLTLPAHAVLIDRGNGLIYDTDLDITWLQDAGLAASNTFGVSGITGNGQMTWYTATTWIAAMNASNYLGQSGWRLPTTTQPDPSCSFINPAGQGYGFGCTGSEMGHLYHVEGVSFSTPGLFENVQSLFYWSTEYVPNTSVAWGFTFYSGYQDADSKGKINDFATWVVHSGDIGAPVPEPGMTFLLGSGLAGLVLYRGRQRRVREATAPAN